MIDLEMNQCIAFENNVQCGRPSRTKIVSGYCQMHHLRIRRNGTCKLKEKGLLCQIEDCKLLCKVRGYCNLHYRRAIREGDIAVVRVPQTSTTCVEPYCDRTTLAKNLCSMHLQRSKSGGGIREEHDAAIREWIMRTGKEPLKDAHILYPGNINTDGYAVKGSKFIHRVIFMERYPDINIQGLHLDHRNNCPRSCVNPEHLTPTHPSDHAKIEAIRKGENLLTDNVFSIISKSLESFPGSQEAMVAALVSCGIRLEVKGIILTMDELR